MDTGRRWATVVVAAPGGGVVATWELAGDGPPDLGTVDELARLHLTASRMGLQLSVQHACPVLVDLLGLVGLSELA